MSEPTDLLIGYLTSVPQDLDLEFERQLGESTTLAFRVAYSVLRHRDDAEDVAQEAIIRAYRGFSRLRDRRRFRAWLVRVAWRLAIDRQRAERRRTEREQVHVRWRAGGAAEGSRLDELWQAIDRLPEKLRLVVVLANVQGHGIREVAELLGLPEGTVKSRLFLARQRLKEFLGWTTNA